MHCRPIILHHVFLYEYLQNVSHDNSLYFQVIILKEKSKFNEFVTNAIFFCQRLYCLSERNVVAYDMEGNHLFQIME